MFSASTSPDSRSGGQLGFSLLELLASILLIAAIAVLSLPTFQDFTPRSERSDARTREALPGGQKTAPSLPAKSRFQDQPPADRLVGKKESGEGQEQREDVRRQ